MPKRKLSAKEDSSSASDSDANTQSNYSDDDSIDVPSTVGSDVELDDEMILSEAEQEDTAVDDQIPEEQPKLVEEQTSVTKSNAEDAAQKYAALSDVMSKILHKKTQKSAPTPILAKSKGIERALDDQKLLEKAKKAALAEKKARQDRDHIMPDITVRIDHEKRLRKVATRGVVKLFNALRQQRKVVDKLKEETSAASLRKEQVAETAKQAFVDFLQTPSTTTKSKPTPNEQDGSWNVLKDEYMMTATLKDWDKSDNEE